MTILEKLRTATKEQHNRIEGENNAALILSHEISMAAYKVLLLQNYIAYKVTENQIEQHLEGYTGDKHRNLLKDLDQLEVDASVAGLYNNKFICKNKAEAFGAAYVVEGSVMGGMVISRELANCKHLSSIKEHHFFNGKRESVKGWKQFTSALKKEEFSPKEEEQAILKAQETFEFFGDIFRETPVLR